MSGGRNTSTEDPQGRRLAYLEAMDIQAWTLRGQPTDQEPAVELPSPGRSLPAPDSQREGADPAVPDLGWDALQGRVAQCTRCVLHGSRTHTVFGVGNRSADWLVIGEAPGRDEDLQGEPFVGRAGQLLNAMLRAIGLKREQVYIANILKCRPPNNRDPQPGEVLSCQPYLMRQIALLEPRIILALGRVAAQNLLRTDTPIGKLRGRVHQIDGVSIPVVATYHPAYLLRSPAEKRKAWQDLQFAVRTLNERRR